jgi:hypothetical protein
MKNKYQENDKKKNNNKKIRIKLDTKIKWKKYSLMKLKKIHKTLKST